MTHAFLISAAAYEIAVEPRSFAEAHEIITKHLGYGGD